MTLLVNEIHIYGSLQRSLILQAADRRITQNGNFHSNRCKLFKIPYINAGVGYFGLAQVNRTDFLSDWLPNFIRHNNKVRTLEEFSLCLCEQLNRQVSKDLLRKSPSGFHICGYNNDNYPELWFIRNIRSMDGIYYKDFTTKYFLSEDFMNRDAPNLSLSNIECANHTYLTLSPPTSGAVDIDPKIPNHIIQYYINGDIRPFHAIWRKLDAFIEEMLIQQDFKHHNHSNILEAIIKWKMEVISSFYKKFAQAQNIGTPIDVITLSPKK